MNAKQLSAAALATIFAVGAVAQNSGEKKTTTTQQAAEAKQREGKTGTSNENAAKQLDRLEKEEKANTKAPPPPSPTPQKK